MLCTSTSESSSLVVNPLGLDEPPRRQGLTPLLPPGLPISRSWPVVATPAGSVTQWPAAEGARDR
jgi:hypothetical protein